LDTGERRPAGNDRPLLEHQGVYRLAGILTVRRREKRFGRNSLNKQNMESFVMKKKPASFYYQDGKLYISRAFERKMFFVLTLVMMLLGLFTKISLL
jgi:hypothetical protein